MASILIEPLSEQAYELLRSWRQCLSYVYYPRLKRPFYLGNRPGACPILPPISCGNTLNKRGPNGNVYFSRCQRRNWFSERKAASS